MSTYRAAVIKEAGAKFEIVEKEIPVPKAGEVLIKVAACGVCHSDRYSVTGWFPGLTYPIVPGHEVIGIVEDVGEGVEWPGVGMVVGVGWHGKHCLFCELCRRGDFVMCPKSQMCIPGIHTEGGYAEYMIAHWTGVAEMPEGIDPVDAAPLLNAGVTVFNGLRHQDNLSVGDLVAIQGIGGLGHLGIQYARKMGFKVAAISTNDSKKDVAKKLGAHHYIDVSKDSASKQLQELGGANCIIATAPNSKAMSDLVNGLAPNGRVVLVGADMQNLEFAPTQVINNRSQVCGWSSGIASDSADACSFAHDQGIKSINEVFPLEQVQEAYEKMANGRPHFRVVLKMGNWETF